VEFQKLFFENLLVADPKTEVSKLKSAVAVSRQQKPVSSKQTSVKSAVSRHMTDVARAQYHMTSQHVTGS
jgi:hypothetical protein